MRRCRSRLQCHDFDHRVGQAVQSILGRAAIGLSAGHGQAEAVAVERDATLDVGRHDRGVVDPAEMAVRKLDEFERMPFEVPELVGRGAARRRRQFLRAPDAHLRRRVRQPGDCRCGIAHRQGEVLEMLVARGGADRVSRPGRIEYLQHHDLLAAPERDLFDALNPEQSGHSRVGTATVHHHDIGQRGVEALGCCQIRYGQLEAKKPVDLHVNACGRAA